MLLYLELKTTFQRYKEKKKFHTFLELAKIILVAINLGAMDSLYIKTIFFILYIHLIKRTIDIQASSYL